MKPPKSRKWDHEMGSQHETDQSLKNQGNGIMKPPKIKEMGSDKNQDKTRLVQI